MKKLLLILVLVFFNFKVVYAHQPKLIKYSPSSNEPHDVISPEISKAYYGKLNGEPHYYKIDKDTEVGITIKIDEILNGFHLFDQNNNINFL